MQKKEIKLCIATGGTGGHLYPALVVYDCCVRRGIEVFLSLNRTPLSEKVLGSYKSSRRPGRDNPLTPFSKGEYGELEVQKHFISAAPTGKRGIYSLFWFLAVNFAGFIQSIRMILTEKPTHILGFGGYSSFAAVSAGRLLLKKVFIFEPNAVSGLSNFIAGFFASKIKAFSGHEFLGAPVRKEFFRKPDEKYLRECGIDLQSRKQRILVMGGSQGSHSINLAVMESLKYMTNISGMVQFVHITGPLDREGVECGYKLYKFDACVMEYCDRIYDLFLACSFAVCRAGASTMWELAAARLPAILVPYPAAKLNHQLKNARKFSERGMAMVVEEKDLNPVFLSKILSEMITGRDLPESMRKFLSRVDIETVPERILEIVQSGE